MDTLLMLLTIAAGSIIFVIINKIFSIAYFGFKGIFITWFCCVLAAYYLGGILLQFKWIIIVDTEFYYNLNVQELFYF
jgi:hypothetical protein